MPNDLRSRLSAALTLGPQVRNASANGTTVDRQGYGGALAVVAFGAYTDGTHTPALQDSPDGTTWTNVAATLQNGSFAAVASAGGANTVQAVSYLGGARYLRVVMTSTGTTTGAASSALIVRGNPSQQY